MPRIIKAIPLSDLLLDPINARFNGEEATSQREAIQLIIDSEATDGKKKLYKLIEHIYINGLDPTEILMVFKHNEEVIVLEGNRRTAALKIIETPELFPSEFYRKKIQALKSEIEPAENFSKVLCSLVEDRDKAAKWLELKHVGQSDGAGRIGWSGSATDTFREFMTGKASIGKQIRKFVHSLTEFDEYTKDAVKRIHITNLTRFFGNSLSKKFFGYVSEANEIKITGDRERAVILMDYAIRYFYDEGLSVSSIKLTTDIARIHDRIRETFPELFREKQSNISETISTESDTCNESKSASQKIEPSTSVKSPRATPSSLNRKRLINYSLKISEPRINELYRDLSRKVDVQDVPSICSAGLRVLIELSVDNYIHVAAKVQPIMQAGNQKQVTVDDKLRVKALAVVQHLKDSQKLSEMQAKGLRGVIGQSSKTGGIGTGSIDQLHLWVHNTGNTPRPSELNSIANDYKVLLEAIWS
tara:strand:- start:1767 stop:3188 length:1422 start_codon:yes stop_codon:yes gene_type:complete